MLKKGIIFLIVCYVLKYHVSWYGFIFFFLKSLTNVSENSENPNWPEDLNCARQTKSASDSVKHFSSFCYGTKEMEQGKEMFILIFFFNFFEQTSSTENVILNNVLNVKVRLRPFTYMQLCRCFLVY